MSRPTRRFSLAALTVIELSPPEMVSAAAAAGFQHVGLRLIPATPEERTYPVIGDTPMVREIRQHLKDEDVTVLDVEVFRLKPETRVQDFLPAIETAASLGAKNLLTTGQDPDTDRLADRFAELCGIAQRFAMSADLEFMPWTEIDSITKASALLTKAGCGNGGLVVDALHFHRTKASLADLHAVPRKWLHFAQLCDAPATPPATMEALIHQARNARLLPGQGGLDLVSFVRALPEDLPISVEIPNAELAKSMTAVDRACAALQAARDVVSIAGSAGD